MSSLVSIGLFIYAFYRKVNINVSDKPLQVVDNILIGTIVLSLITVCLWRYLSKPFIQFLVVVNVLVSTISMNYMYANNILISLSDKAMLQKKLYMYLAMITKMRLLPFVIYKNMIRTFIVFLTQVAPITHQCYKVIMVQVRTKA